MVAFTRTTHRHLSIPATGAPRQLVEELSTLSTQFRTHWVAHPVRIGRYGSKQLHTPTSATWT
ncbi:hypothetical protein [Streptomyces stelliscabiei]|uniref:MmyB family transcriptional regulator n=1 Tax=Streptomyces stelliscabiei TaxID=146820 RepID=UPI002FF1B705